MYSDYAARRTRLALALGLTDEILLVGAGPALAKPEISDQRFPFIAHQEYYYLTGLADAVGGIVAFDPRQASAGPGKDGWVSFVPKVTEAERMWKGAEQLSGDLLDRFQNWFAARTGRRVIMLGAPIPGVGVDWGRTNEAREAYLHARRFKEPSEIELMRHCAYKTGSGYATVRPMLKPGVTERRIQVELEAEYCRRGASGPGYDTTIGSGPNSAVIHPVPSQRAFRDGDFVLIDSGAEVDRYVIAVSRTHVVGHATPFQHDLYQAVLHAQTLAIARCLPGAEWKDVHLGTALDLVAGLVAMGVMRGDPSSLVEQHAYTLFFPHGLGHLVGLGVRDASGVEPGRTKDSHPCLANLRMDLILRSSYLVTVEPGLYFIPAVLNHPHNREMFPDCVNWPLVEKHLNVGGVRLKDTILVNPGPPENLTRIIPKGL